MGKKPTVDEVLKKHSAKIEKKMNSVPKNTGVNYSSAYDRFKKEMAPDLNRYERWGHSLGNLVKLKVAEKDRVRIKKQLDIAHLDIEPWQALTLSVMSFLAVLTLGILSSVAALITLFAPSFSA